MNELNLTPPNYAKIYSKKYMNKSNSKNLTLNNDKIVSTITNSQRKLRNEEGKKPTYKQKLRRIFDFFAQMGESVYTTKIKRKKFFKLCKQMNIIDNILPMKDLEILTVKVLTNKIKNSYSKANN